MTKYDEKKDLWWIEQADMEDKLVDALVRIFKETLRPGRKRIFNLTLLIRQNFLTLCETPELMTILFGQPYVDWWDEEIEDYRWASRLEDEVIERVMNELGLEDAELDEVFKD
jgi:hypothetical protein